MAWATATPLNFGQYFPDGDLVGWDEQIRRYADTFPKEKRKYIHPALIAKKFTKNQDLVRAEESPRLFQINKKPKDLASMFFLTDGLLVVDPALFQIIEKHEPNVHQFFPIQIELPKGELSPVQYHLMVIRNFADAFIPDESLGRSNTSGSRFSLYDKTKKGLSQIKIRNSDINTFHLWRDVRLSGVEFFMSDELQAAIKQAGLNIPTHHKVKEI